MNWRQCICDRGTKRLLLLNPPFPLHIFSITVCSEGFQTHTTSMFPLKCLFYHPYVSPFSPCFCACLGLCHSSRLVSFAVFDPQLPKMYSQRWGLKSPQGFLWSTFPESNRDLTGTCWNKWQRQTLQASHQIRRWTHIKELRKLWRSTVPPQWCSNITFGCHATMTAAAHQIHRLLYVWQGSCLKSYHDIRKWHGSTWFC